MWEPVDQDETDCGLKVAVPSVTSTNTLVPAPPSTLKVKYAPEDGAAGIAFCADGGDKHYGFYPTNGKLRLSRFEGPDVFSWQVLVEKPSEHYKPGDWNRLKVRVEKDKLQCFVNDNCA